MKLCYLKPELHFCCSDLPVALLNKIQYKHNGNINLTMVIKLK